MKNIFTLILLFTIVCLPSVGLSQSPYNPSHASGIWNGYSLGTMTNGYLCTYATGNTISCNTATTDYMAKATFTEQGDILYASAAATPAALAHGAAGNPLISGGNAANPSFLSVVLAGGTNTFSVTNGTASLDIAASATLNVDTSLTVQTGAVTLTGNAAGSTVTLPAGAVTYPIPTAAGSFICATGAGVYADCTTMSSSDSAAQFYDATSTTRTLLLDVAGTADNKSQTVKYTFDQSNTIEFDVSALGADSKTVKFTSSATDDRTYTFPDASITVARTDAGQTFTGVQAFTAPTVATSIAPASADGATLGTATYEFSDLYLADGGVIYFQNDQSVYLTPSAGTLTLTGSFVTADVTNDNYIQITNNAGGRAATASKYELYPDAGVWKVNTNGTESTMVDSANIINYAETLLSNTTVTFAADGDTALYTVPTGKTCVLTKAIIVAAADCGSTDITIGANGAETDFLGTQQLDNLDAAGDAAILMPVPNATPAKIKAYAATTVIDINVANHAGAAGNKVLLFGVCY